MDHSLYQTIINCSGTHSSVASVAYQVLQPIVFDGKSWHRFDGSLWKPDECAILLRQQLSGIVKQYFVMVHNQIAPDPSMTSVVSTLQRIIGHLDSRNYKHDLAKELQEWFYDPQFVQRLDANPNLLAFTNGVWDLRGKCFRHATLDDMLSLSVGFPYLPYEDLEVRKKMVRRNTMTLCNT